jgi:hypothetical protein
MESFQPGLKFNPINRAEIVSRLHGKFQPGVSLNFSSNRGVMKYQPRLKRSGLKMEVVHFFEEFKKLFMWLLLDFCELLWLHVKIEQSEIKRCLIKRCFFSTRFEISRRLHDDFSAQSNRLKFAAR